MNATANNISDYFLPPDALWFDRIKLMRSIFVPLLVSVGLIGNSLCLIVFSTRSMKKSPCSTFLSSLAVVDNTFLLCLLITWIDGQIFVVLKVNFACQVLIFTTYVTSALSVWFIVCFTFERFIAICFPMKNTYLCTMRREKGAVVILVFFACGFYHFSFWTTGMEPLGDHLICAHNPEYINFMRIVTWIDTMMTMVIPFILLSVMNLMALCRVLSCHFKSVPCTQPRPVLFKATSIESDLDGKVVTIIRRRNPIRVAKVQRLNPQIRVTRTLIFVSTTFLILNLPSHSIRLYNLITFVTSTQSNVSIQFSFLQELTLILYYMTFSCNFFLYSCFGQNFRTSLSHLLHCRSTKERRRRMVLHRLSSTQATCATSSC